MSGFNTSSSVHRLDALTKQRRNGKRNSGPCLKCRLGDHHLCCGVRCWDCPTPHRRFGLFGGGNGLVGGSKP